MMTKSKPPGVHIKAMIASLVPVLFAVLFSWVFPLVNFTLTRVSPDRVDCLVEQRVLGVIPLTSMHVTDLVGAYAFEISGNSRTGDRQNPATPHLKLVDANDNEILVAANGATFNELAAQLRAFCGDSTESTLELWTVPFLGYLAVIPLLVGLMFGSLVLTDFVRSSLRRLQPSSTDETTG